MSGQERTGRVAIGARGVLLVLWVALLGATRIDFLAGAGPFVLTPFLVLSPLVVAVELGHLARTGWALRIPPRADAYLLATSALLALILVSTFLSYDLVVSAQRFSLLAAHVVLVFAVGLAFANRDDARRLLVRGAVLGLVLSLVMDAGQLLVWLRDSLWPPALERVISLEPGSYAEIVPRFTGLSHDPNLGGLSVVFFLGLLALLDRRPAGRGLDAASLGRSAFFALGALAVVATLSRSALLAAGVLWFAIVLSRRGVSLTPAGVGVAAAAMAAVTALYYVVPGVVEPLADSAELLTDRLSFEEGSTSERILLLERGWDVATRDLKHFFLGIGYGNAYLFVQDIFPGNEYGNFHSLYVTLLAEAGIFTALAAIWLLFHVLLRSGPYWPLVLALIVFNAFQQAHTGPIFWLTLLLAWLGVGVGGAGAGPEARERKVEHSPAPVLPLRTSRSLLLVPLLLALTACSDVFTEPFRYGTVEVVTERRSGDPVPGSEVILFTGTRQLDFGITDAEGRQRFDFVPLGPVAVRVLEPEGYTSRQPENVASFRMEEGASDGAAFTFYKIGPGRVEVTVLDQEREPVPFLSVELYSPDEVVEQGFTDLLGFRSFSGVPYGEHGVRIFLPRGVSASGEGGRVEGDGQLLVFDGFIVDEGYTERVAAEVVRCLAGVRVRARTAGGAPLADVAVELYRATGTVSAGRTGPDGVLDFEGVLCGDYGVRVGAVEGHDLVSPAAGFVDGIVLEAGSERTVEFVFEER